MPGCPIRKSTDQIVCADPRSLSQLITSFVASESLGIHRLPLSVFAPNVVQYCYRKHAGCILTYLICSTLFSRLFLSSMSMIASEGSAEAAAFRCLDQEQLALKEVHHSRGFLSTQVSSLAFRRGRRFSFAVAKIEQNINTNQITPRNISFIPALSYLHLPLN